MPLTRDEGIAETRKLFALTSVKAMTPDLLSAALDAITAHGMPLWDAEIFAAAKLHGGSTILSEDFQHGRVIEGITFLNPFSAGFDIVALLKTA